MARVGRIELAAFADRFIHHVPAVHNAGKFLLKVGDDLRDVALQSLEHHLPADKRLACVVLLVEKPRRHIGIPHQHMPAHAEAILLRPSDHLVRRAKIHARHPVAAGAAFALVKQRVRLHLVRRRDAVAVRFQEVQVVRVP